MSDERLLEQYFIRHSFGENRKLTMVPAGATAIRCHNGVFVGKEQGGVEIYKGIPFALSPVGRLRWRAPVSCPEDTDIREAYYNGCSPIQTECETERASYYPQSEDCLYLNIWTGSRTEEAEEEKRAVMVFLHGGAYGWGGTADPLYDGWNFVSAHPDVVLVTVGYRVGLLGFVDLSSLEGGEDYPDAPNLGLLDQIEALRWIRRNCSAFGGDPDNITVFGESAGGGSVSLLPLIPAAKGLFRRVIAQSGSIALTFSKEECRPFTERLVKESGLTSVKELLRLSEEQLKKLNEKLNDYNNFPQRNGRVIPENLYKAYRDGLSADVDFLSGTNENEMNYWIGEAGGLMPFRAFLAVKFENDMRLLSERSRKRVDRFLKRGKGHILWRLSAFYTELMFRQPAIFQAAAHAESGGRAFLYLWKIRSSIPRYRACHAVELSYVFGNTEDTIYTGTPADPELSSRVQQMWVNFAKSGDPSLPDLKWPCYERSLRKTMILTDEFHVEEDSGWENRLLLFPLLKYRINPSYVNLDLNTHYVRRTAGLGILLAAGLIAGTTALLVALLNRKP